MKIGIIGAGQIGSTIMRKLSAAGHKVQLADVRGTHEIKPIADEAGAVCVAVSDAAKNVDVLIISIPTKGILELPKNLLDGAAKDLIVVDTSNYYPGMRDEPIAAIEAGMPESLWVSEQLGRPVVKAFNSLLAHSLGNKGMPKGSKGRIATSVSGDDAREKKVVIELVDAVGFDGLDVGSLKDSWRHQPGSPAYCTDLGAEDLLKALAQADKSQLPRRRDLAIKKVGELKEGFTIDDVLHINRTLE